MTGRRSPRGLSMSPASFNAGTRADPLFPPIPAGSVSRRAPLKSAQLSETALDYLKLFGVLSFVVVTGLSIAFGGFILLFVKT